MPKLLLINITRNQGSTGKINEQIGLIMQQRGWEVCVAHGARFVNPSALPSYQIQSVREEYLHALKSLLLDADGLGSTWATKRLVNFIKDYRPDVIQINNIHGYYLNYKVLFDYLNTTNIPIVMTLHDCWAFTGHCTHFVTADCERWKEECGCCPLSKSVPKSLLFDKSKRNLAYKRKYIANNNNLHIVCVSRWLKDLVEQSIYANKNSYLFYNGIDLNVFKLTKEKRKDKYCILGVGNPWSKEKGLYDIYKLRELLPENEYEITLVGLNKKQKESLPQGIRGILRTNNQQELVELYSESHVFINPTYADTFPTTNLEALACGTPIITYKTGGSPEALSQNTGIIVKQGDVNALKDAVVKTRTHPFSSNACRQRVETYFDKNKRFLDYAELYERLIK